MDNWSRKTKISYKKWRKKQSEDDLSDSGICNIAFVELEGIKSASGSGCDQTQETFTVDDAIEAFGFGKFQWKMCFLTGLSWVGDAMEMMILSILGPYLHCDWRLPSYQVALMTSVVFAGIALSSPVIGNICDTYGRKIGLIISMCWALFYGLLSAFAPAYGWLLVLRGLVGMGIAGAPQSVTLYSEFLPMKSRGISIMLISVFWSLGAIFEVLLALLIMPTLGWRWQLGLSTIPIAIFICFSFWLPESVRFNVLTGKTEKAMATLRHIAKENGKAMPQGKLTTYKQNARGQIKDLLSPQYRKTTLLLWFMWFAYSFCYFGIVLLTTELFQVKHFCETKQGPKIEPNCSLECKYLTPDDYKDLLWTAFAEFPGTIVSLLAIDYIGRKNGLALCFLTFFFFLLPIYGCIGRTAVTICIFVARAFISGGYQVVFVYTPEVFPTENRALAMGTSSAISKLGSLITPFVAQVLLRTSVQGTLTLYCGLSLLGGVASFMLPLETLGKSLQESRLDQDAEDQISTRCQLTTQDCEPKGPSPVSSDEEQRDNLITDRE